MGCCPQGHTESDTTEVPQHACMHWRRKWQPTPVFLPGESEGWGSLLGCHLWGCTESDTTEATQQQQQQQHEPNIPGFLCNSVLIALDLLSPPDTSTTGHYFCIGSASSFFLELFVQVPPVAYWTLTNLKGSSFSVISFCLFILFMGFLRQEC